MIITGQKWHLSGDCATLTWKIDVSEGVTIGGVASLDGTLDQAMEYVLLFKEKIIEFIEETPLEIALEKLNGLNQRFGK